MKISNISIHDTKVISWQKWEERLEDCGIQDFDRGKIKW
jgi:hypothetical protein